jgi:hypothetical protein
MEEMSAHRTKDQLVIEELKDLIPDSGFPLLAFFRGTSDLAGFLRKLF